MSKNRIKVAPAPIITRAQMEQKVARIAKLKIAEQARVAEMNGEIEMIKRQHANPLNCLREELDIHCEDVRLWAEANPADFGKLRSLDLTHAIIGWRTGNPTLKTLRGCARPIRRQPRPKGHREQMSERLKSAVILGLGLGFTAVRFAMHILLP